MRLFLILWSALWTLGVPVVLIYLAHRSRKDAGYRQHLSERFGRYRDPLPGAVWVHAVSLGELRSAVPLIRALLDRGERVVTTHITPAGRRESEAVFATDIAAGRLRAVWVPLETGWAYGGFFRAYRPVYGLVMEIEIWPRMVFAARRAKVPLLMCNAQYPSRAITRDSAGLRLRQRVMQGFAGALVKSELQARRFASVGVRNIVVTGETRFDQPVPPHLVAAGRAARDWIGAGARRVVTIASAIEGEDPVYIHAIRALRDDHCARGLQPPLIVYVPRRPERFDHVARTLDAAGFVVARRSTLWPSLDPASWGPAPPTPDILLGDSLGEMYAYLAMADQVVVGGGFNPKGAHNISEALVLLRPVVTGPHTWTIEFPFAEAEAAGVARSVPDAAGLATALIDGPWPDESRIEDFVAGMRGGAERTLAALPAVLALARKTA